MVRSGISLEVKKDLLIDAGPDNGRATTLTALRKIHKILDNHVVTYAGFFYDNFLFMYATATAHTVLGKAEYLQHDEIPVMKWPPRISDMNLIKHL